MDDMLY